MRTRTQPARGFVALLAALLLSMALTGGIVSARGATPAASPAASPVGSTSVQLTGLVETPATLTVADLQKLPSQTVNVTFKAGTAAQTHSFTGVLLADVLARAKLKLDSKIKNDQLRFYMVVTANDGSTAVISYGEIDPFFGNQPILVAWEQDGKPLTGTDGPVRLVTPGDVKGGRYVSGVVAIDVRSSDAAS